MKTLLYCFRQVVGRLFFLIATTLPSWADGDGFAGLRANSPFGSEPATIVTSKPALEFRGYVCTGESAIFNIASPDAGGRLRSAWVEINESNADYVVRSFDQTTDTVQVEHRGQRLTLKLKLNRVRVLQAPERLELGEEPVVVADDKARLEAISAEIRRRRALRQANADETSPR